MTNQVLILNRKSQTNSVGRIYLVINEKRFDKLSQADKLIFDTR